MIYFVELSGGGNFIPDSIAELLKLQDKYALHFLVHNYFPPPKNHFILNLASVDDLTWNNTINFMKHSIDIACQLASPVYGVHAGFYINPHVHEIGQKFQKHTIFDKAKALKRFVEGYLILQDYNKDRIKLYIENNVISLANYQTYSENPFMLTTFEEYEELSQLIDFSLLFDIGHYKVSANVLKKDFTNTVEQFLKQSEYIHISDNDGKSDLNFLPSNDSLIYTILSKIAHTHRYITLEISVPIEKLSQFYKGIM